MHKKTGGFFQFRRSFKCFCHKREENLDLEGRPPNISFLSIGKTIKIQFRRLFWKYFCGKRRKIPENTFNLEVALQMFLKIIDSEGLFSKKFFKLMKNHKNCFGLNC